DLEETFGFGKILSKGLRVAILGKPNVGKSSLFNRFVLADRAIVTNTPGTTRDVLTESISFDGVPLCFADTAGIRETADEVESIGVSRTFQALTDSDLALAVLDGSGMLDDNDRQTLAKAGCVPHVIVINKIDLPQKIDLSALDGASPIYVSAKTAEGLDQLAGDVVTDDILDRIFSTFCIGK